MIITKKFLGHLPISLALFAGYLLGGCYTASSLSTRRQDIDQAAAELPALEKPFAATGWPWQSPAEPKIDDASNAASYLLSIQQKLSSLTPSLLPRIEGLSVAWRFRQRADQISKSPDRDEILSLLNQASSRPELSLHFDDGPFDKQSLSIGFQLPTLLRLLCLEAERQASLGHGSKAADYLNQAWKLFRIAIVHPLVLDPQILVEKFENLCATVENCIAAIEPVLMPSTVNAPSSIQPNPNSRQPVLTPGGSTPTKSASSANPAVFTALSDFKRELRLTPIDFSLRSLVENRIAASIRENWVEDPSADEPMSDDPMSADGVPQSTTEKAKLARVLEFWSSQKAALAELDQHPVEGTNAIDDGLIEIRRQSGPSYAGTRSIVRALNPSASTTVYQSRITSQQSVGANRPFHSLATAYRNMNPLIQAEGILIDAAIFRAAKGQWPKDVAQLGSMFHEDRTAPDSFHLSQSGFQATLKSAFPDTRSMAFISSREMLTPVASIPPIWTQDDLDSSADARKIAQQPIDDVGKAAKMVHESFRAYTAAGLPMLSEIEPWTRAQNVLDIQSGRDQQMASNAQLIKKGIPPSAQDLDSAPIEKILNLADPSSSAKPDRDGAPLSQISTNIELAHFCVFRLVEIDCYQAREEAARGHGIMVAKLLNEAWEQMLRLRSEPKELAFSAYAPAIYKISTAIEQDSAALYPDYSEFLNFSKALDCSEDPIGTREVVRQEILSEWGVNPPVVGSGVRSQTEKNQNNAGDARLWQYWTGLHALVNDANSRGDELINQIRSRVQHPGFPSRASDSLLNGKLKQFYNTKLLLLECYALRDAERLMLKALIFKHDHKSWPKDLKSIAPNLTQPELATWEILRDPKSFQISLKSGDASPSNFSIDGKLRPPPSPIMEIVAAYPALKSQD
jgi:hypothetical protein